MVESSDQTSLETAVSRQHRARVYANWFYVAASDTDVIVDFGQQLPSADIPQEEAKPIIVSRFIVSRQGAEALVKLLQDQLGATTNAGAEDEN